MGKATRWLKGLLTGGVKRTTAATKDRSLVSSFRSEDADNVGSQGRTASTVAAASAAVAQAAVATAQAAVAVMKLTSSGRICGAPTAKIAAELAAVKIQSIFRGYLARRALKALKGLVKLQALVRGHIVRKQTAEKFRRMQALLRVQARARTCRQPFVNPCPPHKDYYRRTISHATGEGVMMIDSNMLQSPGWKWLDKRMEQCYWDTQQGRASADMEADVKTLEIDYGRPPPTAAAATTTTTTSSNASRLSCGQYYPSSPSGKVPSQRRIATSPLSMDSANGSQFFSASSARTSRGAFSPTTSECSGSFLSGYIGHPSYMAYTESSRAKKRSSSAPKHRADFESAVAAKKGASARGRNNGHYGRHYMCSPSHSSRAYSYGTPARFEYHTHRGDGRDGMGMAVGL